MRVDLSGGACFGLADETFANDDPFYPKGMDGEAPDYSRAKAICALCKVRDTCLQEALAQPVQWGFRAGMQEEERRALQQGKPLPDRTAGRLELYEQHLNDKDIAAALGITDKTVMAWRRRNNLPANHRAHLPHTEAQTTQKWELWKAGYPDRVIGEHIGVTSDAIRRWRRRENLKPGPVAARQQVPA